MEKIFAALCYFSPFIFGFSMYKWVLDKNVNSAVVVFFFSGFVFLGGYLAKNYEVERKVQKYCHCRSNVCICTYPDDSEMDEPDPNREIRMK